MNQIWSGDKGQPVLGRGKGLAGQIPTFER